MATVRSTLSCNSLVSIVGSTWNEYVGAPNKNSPRSFLRVCRVVSLLGVLPAYGAWSWTHEDEKENDATDDGRQNPTPFGPLRVSRLDLRSWTPYALSISCDLRMSLRNDTYLGERIERLDGRDPVELGEEVLGGWVIVERLVVARRVVQPEVWLEHGQRERRGELMVASNGQLQ